MLVKSTDGKDVSVTRLGQDLCCLICALSCQTLQVKILNNNH